LVEQRFCKAQVRSSILLGGFFATLAQLEERLTRNEQVAGSDPAGGPFLPEIPGGQHGLQSRALRVRFLSGWPCRRSSVVERCLGKTEVVSSNLTGGFMTKTIGQLVEEGSWLKWIQDGDKKILSTDPDFVAWFEKWKNHDKSAAKMSLVYERSSP
tara:strand:- start:8060 stop:8527 length:468 start_codon:yes stop_codon:yes gene_type:complete